VTASHASTLGIPCDDAVTLPDKRQDNPLKQSSLDPDNYDINKPFKKHLILVNMPELFHYA
jgi:hypothetical protein